MGVDFYAIVIYGKVNEHDEYPGAKDCCKKEKLGDIMNKFCRDCGTKLGTLETNLFDDVYPRAWLHDDFTFGENAEKQLIGEVVHELSCDDPPTELKTLSKEQEEIVNKDLGGGCKYIIYQHVSY